MYYDRMQGGSYTARRMQMSVKQSDIYSCVGNSTASLLACLHSNNTPVLNHPLCKHKNVID